MNEKEYDRLLKIETGGTWEWLYQSLHYNRYEATPYDAIDHLFEEYELKRTDGVVDFGCGKGRLVFYIHHRFHARATGIEINGQLYQEALENQARYLKKKKRADNAVRFECCPAEEYDIEKEENKFYFFNPFSVQIFMRVVHHILRSVEEHQRPVDLILYYPTAEYIQFLDMYTPFQLLKEVKIPELYEKNENERFLVFRYEG
ncbi:class I SAM-dependent methyltransferase [Pseudobacillus badius]|uniref:class I SAM-dependent methyltransferase n=1 Tax=Bacillus badius TaxID=1455 RepID=UPI0005975F0D|nr:class I SAM-dependent methyltransferase [Bacillus badius]KIL76738.1 Glycerate kinase [Bacillus badius]KZR57735.1 SAM-dependent methyltransferase [Bacillus badius]